MFICNTCENNIKGDIYIGCSSGKQVTEAIQNAKRRIWILSPYIASETVNMLIDKYDRDVNIKLVTSEKEVRKVRKRESKISNFIIETGTPDTVKLAKFIIAIAASVILFTSALVLIILFLLNKSEFTISLFNLLPIIFLSPIYFLFKYALKIRFINYSYATKIPIYFFKDPYAENNFGKEAIPFLHAKIYLIDDTVYIGSLNFTNEGFGSNIETRFKTEDKDLIEKIVELFLKVQNDNQLIVDIPLLGYRVFHRNKFFTDKNHRKSPT